MTKSKRKLMISLLVMMLIMLSVVAIVTMAFAAQQQNISTKLKINYYATRNVYATITGGVYSNNAKTQDINFTINGDTENGDLGLNDIDIDSTNSDKSVYIEFKITNNQPNEENGEFYINPAINASESTNIKTTRNISFADDLNYEEFSENNIYLQQNKTVYIRLKFKVENIAYNASLKGQLTLNFYSVDSNELPANVSTSSISGVGMYPQTYVGDTLNTTLKSATLSATGKTYTTDIVGTTTTLTEYSYNDVTVAKLDSAKTYQSDYTFSTGETITSNSTYFFYVQPIKVSAMEARDTKMVWITKSLVFSQMFNTSAEGNSAWEISPLRTFLNGTFLTESGISATEISIENGTTSGSYTEQANTTDTLWLPSKTEMEKWYTTDDLRKKAPTDMAMATYAYYNTNNNTGYYATRSAESSTNIYIVGSSGSITRDGTYYVRRGVSFAFAM